MHVKDHPSSAAKIGMDPGVNEQTSAASHDRIPRPTCHDRKNTYFSNSPTNHLTPPPQLIFISKLQLLNSVSPPPSTHTHTYTPLQRWQIRSPPSSFSILILASEALSALSSMLLSDFRNEDIVLSSLRITVIQSIALKSVAMVSWP